MAADKHPSPNLKVLVFAASLRAESLNHKLATLATRIAEQNGATVHVSQSRLLGIGLASVQRSC